MENSHFSLVDTGGKWKEMENGRIREIEYLRIQGIDGNIVYFTNLFLGFRKGKIMRQNGHFSDNYCSYVVVVR